MLKELHTNTAVESFRCECFCGHSFVANIVVAIDMDTDFSLIDGFDDAGNQTIVCSDCHELLSIAQPVQIHSGKCETYALLVPRCLTHLAWPLKAELLQLISAANPSKTPEYVYRFATVSAKPLLLSLLSSAVGAPTDKPQIHRAFADLASIVPSPAGKRISDAPKKII